MRLRSLFALALLGAAVPAARAQTPLGQDLGLTRADTLRGSVTPERAWWDVTFYDLAVRVSPSDSSLRGRSAVTYRVLDPGRTLQLDLQAPLVLDSVVQRGRRLAVRAEGNAHFVALTAPQPKGALETVTAYFHGRPRVAIRAPWDGGFVWTRDSLGNPWVATAVQGLGASAWWPTKDLQSDEPDSQRVAITVPTGMTNVSNGRLRGTTRHADGTTTFEWAVRNPINNYNVAVNAGRYAHYSDTFAGENGPLTLDFYPLAYNEARARRHFAQDVKPMLACFEHWFGPYPWYEDGFKIVETPHLGMEHQSANAYGNGYRNGYRGRDLSGTGRGLSWDFIVIHEAGHEWWGNNLTTRDIADMWVHESFTNYSENLYVECGQGAAAGAEYVIGTRALIRNDVPIVGPYGVNREGSGDMYYKGGNMLHTIRQLVGDDDKWRQILRGLQLTYRHQTVTGREVERYITQQSGLDLAPVFDQYLRTTMIPALEYRTEGTTLFYRWADAVPDFALRLPVRFTAAGPYVSLRPTTSWQTTEAPAGAELHADPDYFVRVRRIAP